MNDVALAPEDLTPQWLSTALGRPVNDVTVERVGTGQIGSCFRVTLDGGQRVLAKLPAADPDLRALLAGAYRAEVRFYTDLAPTVDIAVPRLHYAAIHPDVGEFTLLLDDLAPWQPGDQLAGCTPAQAEAAVRNLARLHGPRWCDRTLTEIDGLALNGPDDADLLGEVYGPATEIFVTAFDDQLPEPDQKVLRQCVAASRDWLLGRAERFALVHGDYRLDNLLFAPDPADPGHPMSTVSAVDWQTLSLALPARDLAYFIATSLPTQHRRQHEKALVAAYYDELSGYHPSDYALADCWDDYRFGMLQAPLVCVLGCAYGRRTARGDAMFTTMARRACAAIRDHETLGFFA